MANYVITEEQKKKIEEVMRDVSHSLIRGVHEKKADADNILFEFLYLKPLPLDGYRLSRYNRFIKGW